MHRVAQLTKKERPKAAADAQKKLWIYKTRKESKSFLRVPSELFHCASVALITSRRTVLPFAVAAARLCAPDLAYGVSSA